MERIELNIGGKDFVFAVDFEDDYDAGAPWEMADGHGPVTGWERRNKRPGELVLNSDRGAKRFYDFAEACRIALRDGWGLSEDSLADWTERAGRTPTRRQIAAAAALSDFEYLRGWCVDQWRYVGVVVTLLDPQGEKTEVSDSLWGVETLHDFHHETARQLADELAHGYGVRWTEAQKPTYEYFAQEGA
ncbi:hypothetical protein [Pseudomonas aeruginosa]|uniref:hypothetical protein n=1 Tax=Pseudomonas aeruginosa TaxID=287 RepID=UPI002358B250|nr:hypothetical protein [Pseudomonas aeruginosa]MDC8987012.1 hypothetical protein [Pseudomonas aeruginosa]